MKIVQVSVATNPDGGGWLVIVTTDDEQDHTVGGSPIYDMTQVLAEVARWTGRMLLGHEWLA